MTINKSMESDCSQHSYFDFKDLLLCLCGWGGMSGCVMCVAPGRVYGDVKEQKLKVKMIAR